MTPKTHHEGTGKETQYRSYADWYSRGPFAPFVEGRRLANADVPVSLTRLAQPPGDFSDPAIPDVVLLLALGGPYTPLLDLGVGETRRTARRGSIEIIPAHQKTKIVVDQPHRILAMAFPAATARPLFDQVFERCDPDLGWLHERGFRDPLIERLILSIWDEAVDDNPQGRLFVEGALTTLIARLAALRGRARSETGHPLSPSMMARIEALMVEAFDDPPGLAALAQEAGLSESQFLRAFKAATGLPPHQWLMSRRVERACELLRSTGDALAEIAYACGFASQSHMTDVFRAKLGVTPGRYRREVRS